LTQPESKGKLLMNNEQQKVGKMINIKKRFYMVKSERQNL